MANTRQDWEPVIFRKRNGVGASARPIIEVQHRRTGEDKVVGARLAKVDADTEELSHARVSVAVSKRIVELRLAKKLTQANLAQMVNEPLATVRSYENGTAIPTPAIKNKLARVLGVATLNV